MRTEVFSLMIAIVSFAASTALADEPLPPAPAVPVTPAVEPAPAPAPVAAVSAPGTVEPASPWGRSPHVVAYRPPAVADRTHRGFTLELALGGGTTPDGGTGSGAFAAGLWLRRDLALTFRATGIGEYQFIGGSLQYYARPKVWLGAGAGSLNENAKSFDAMPRSALGGFVRAGYNLGAKGGHTLYVSGEAQVTQLEGSQPMVLSLFALGYQLR